MSDKENKESIGEKITRRLSRVSERFKETFGHADKTVDQSFEECLTEFVQLYANIIEYERAARKYYENLKNLSEANHSFLDALWDVYDPSWIESDSVKVKIDMIEKNYEKTLRNFKISVLLPLHFYVKRVQEIRSKIQQREDKRLDYDACRRNLEKLEGNPDADKTKMEKAKKAMDDSRIPYDEINVELLEELPNFAEARAYFLSLIMNGFAVEEFRFHAEAAKYFELMSQNVQVLKRNSISAKELQDYIDKEQGSSLSYMAELSDNSSGLSTPESAEEAMKVLHISMKR